MLKVAFSSVYNHPLPEGHRFPMVKYDLIHEQLVYEGTLKEENFFDPGPVKENWILQTHKEDYWTKLKSLKLSKLEERRTGFPLSNDLVYREVVVMNGTLKAAEYALQGKIAFNVAGGTHHAYADKGEGFCLLNDNAIAANYLLSAGKAKKILILDLDVHQGNGTAAIFETDDRVFTFSIHGKNNLFSNREHSNLDIALPDNAGDSYYLETLQSALPRVVDQFQPDFVFYQAGVDVLKTDKLGKLSMTRKGVKDRDSFVLSTCLKNNLPIVVNMGGGYSEKISDIVESHCNTFRLALDYFF